MIIKFVIFISFIKYKYFFKDRKMLDKFLKRNK